MSRYFYGNTPEIPSMGLLYAVSSQFNGLAKTAKFAVKIIPDGPDNIMNNSGYGRGLRDLTFLCEAAEFPGRGMMTTDIRYYGPNFKTPFQTSYEDLNLTFLVRENFLEREIFDSWMETINPNFNYDFFYRDDYSCTIRIYSLSDVELYGANYVFTFKKAWPVLVNPQPVTWADDNFHRLSVSFTYANWIREGIDERSPNSGGPPLASPEG